MLKEESVWIKQVLDEADLSAVKEMLDVGSSTKEFRTRIQPYIDENVFKPLRGKNINITYLDRKSGDVVDLVYDLEKVQAVDIGKQFDLVICCNLLEHVRKPRELASLLIDLISKNGFLLITVPRAYRHHADPIDTMFRPSVKELLPMFPGLKVIREAVVRVRDKDKYRITEFIRYIVPFLNWKVSCLFMKKS